MQELVNRDEPTLSFKAAHSSAKPRTRGLTSVIDFGPDTFGWTGPQGVADYLTCAAEYIDYAKIYALNALILPEAAAKAIIGHYRDANVIPYSGGILFEYAWQRGEIEEFFKLLKRLGMPRLEISENYITLSADDRRKYIGMANDRGFSVIYEFGRKNPEEPMSIDLLEDIVSGNAKMGVDHTIIEQSEIDFTAEKDPEILKTILARPWFSKIFIEADPYAFPKEHVALLEKFGRNVNLANITAGQALRLQGFRYGVGRAVNYSVIEKSYEAHGN